MRRIRLSRKEKGKRREGINTSKVIDPPGPSPGIKLRRMKHAIGTKKAMD